MSEKGQEALDEMDVYQRFEHYFPFYRMDVNGYMNLLKKACKITHPDKAEHEVKDVSLTALREVFSKHKSWSALNDEESEFVRFLEATCEFLCSEVPEETHFSTRKLRALGLLWCEGDPNEKVVEFYDII